MVFSSISLLYLQLPSHQTVSKENTTQPVLGSIDEVLVHHALFEDGNMVKWMVNAALVNKHSYDGPDGMQMLPPVINLDININVTHSHIVLLQKSSSGDDSAIAVMDEKDDELPHVRLENKLGHTAG